jgi:hypothetical protein
VTSASIPFAELCQAEPRLAELERDIRSVKDTGKEFCANEHWYVSPGFRARLYHLAGWHAEKPELRTSQAYDIAYDHLYALLPNCRKCRCIALENAMGLRPATRGRRRP